MNSWKDSVLAFLVQLSLALGGVMGLLFLGLWMSGNTVTDAERQFLKNATSLKAECEKPLPRTQQCVLQYIPEQQ